VCKSAVFLKLSKNARAAYKGEPMGFRLASAVVGALVVVESALVLSCTEKTAPEPAGSARAQTPQSPSAPPAAASPSQASGAPSPLRSNPREGDAPAIAWNVPSGWRTVPNPSSMRLATYRASTDPADTDAPETSVSRAGGTPEANIQRWLGQFSDAEPPRRSEDKVSGLSVSRVEVGGTYNGGGMMPGAGAQDSAPKAGWMLVGAIVQTAGAPYFFKMVGPKAKVMAARKAFDSMIDSVTPR